MPVPTTAPASSLQYYPAPDTPVKTPPSAKQPVVLPPAEITNPTINVPSAIPGAAVTPSPPPPPANVVEPFVTPQPAAPTVPPSVMPTPSVQPTDAVPATLTPASPFANPNAVDSRPASQPTLIVMPPQQTVASLPSRPPYDPTPTLVRDRPDFLGSTYIPVDSPIYPLALRLYSLGYIKTSFISMRPWTRRSLLHALDESSADIVAGGDEQAQLILTSLQRELADEVPGKGQTRGTVYGLETAYSRLLGITGTPLRDSFHLGQTLVNDYGRPYAEGFNNITGFSSVNEKGRFSLYVRGEFQHAPMGDSYSYALANSLACSDYVCLTPPNFPQDTIPYGPTVRARDTFRLQEAVVSAHLAGHEFSFGKSDAWLGPGMGGGMAWSNNAEDIYSFRINRVEPLRIPLISSILGPMRYDFFVGSLKGHTAPNSPWVHSEMFAFRPTENVEFGFQRTVIWGGRNHEEISLHTFLRSFFDINDTTGGEKQSNKDPGARYTAFNFSWRLPYLRRYVTLYTDSESHDDVTPASAPRRAAYRPGIFLSQFPHMPKLDLRVEAADTDPPVLRSMLGQFNYWEVIQLQGYTNKGFIMGDWIGREAKGGQAWLTYHLSGDEWVQLSYLNKKTPKDFIPGGTTQNQFKVDMLKHLGHDLTVDAWLQYERWKAPIYKSGLQSDTSIAVQFTWRPGLRVSPGTK